MAQNKPSRRVLGLPFKTPELAKLGPEAMQDLEAESYVCPICGEEMVTLSQLNQHIDDAHSRANGSPMQKQGQRGKTTPQKRILTLDLHDNNSGFGLSENRLDSPVTVQLTRSHWVHPASSKSNRCSHPGCLNVLNVKNGIVNCRLCGQLYCNTHSRYRARLSNGPPPKKLPVYDSVHGSFALVCQGCYWKRPGLQLGTQVNSNERTSEFLSMRRKTIDEKQLARSITQKRFIKTVDLLAAAYLWHVEHKSSFFLALSHSIAADGSDYSADGLLESQKSIVGMENWENDKTITHCKLCFVKFNILIRKHHCRLCGSVVSDIAYNNETEDLSQSCSVQVPAGLLMQKLSGLNYSPLVKKNWGSLISVSPTGDKFSNIFSFRCCRTCKDQLLHTSRLNNEESGEDAEVLASYQEILALKSHISTSMARYKQLILETKDSNNQQINKLRLKLSKSAKDLELTIKTYQRRFFPPDLGPHSALKVNVYKSTIMYLQDSISELKALNDEFQTQENSRLAEQLGLPAGASSESSAIASPAMAKSPTPPRLTKKQIRELREQLMVTKEQKFLVENSMEELRKQRRFDVLETLEENREELDKAIASLKEELGEFGFDE